MLRIAVCDDENTIAVRIEQLLTAICERENILVEIDVYYSGAELEKHYADELRYDLLYMDIQMEGGDGITAVSNIRKIDENVMIIFISGYDQYMISLFRLDVYAFIRKPIDGGEFEKTFLEVFEKISRRNHYFIYRYMNTEYKVSCSDILYFQSEGRKVYIYTSDNHEEIFNGKIGDVEAVLRNGKVPFLRVHQSYLVNYHMIRSRTRTEITMVNGQRIPISEDRQKYFSTEYGRLLGGEIRL